MGSVKENGMPINDTMSQVAVKKIIWARRKWEIHWWVNLNHAHAKKAERDFIFKDYNIVTPTSAHKAKGIGGSMRERERHHWNLLMVIMDKQRIKP